MIIAVFKKAAVIALITASITGYSQIDTPLSVQLQGRWSLIEPGGDSSKVPGVYFEIDGDGIAGYDGCNRFSGTLSEPARVRSTERACAGDVQTIDPTQLILQLPEAVKELLNESMPIELNDTLFVFYRDL